MIRRRFALLLVRACARILPARQADWARAMEAELQVIDRAGAAIGFAAGCLWASSRERMFGMNQAYRNTRLALVALMAAMALLLASSAARLAEVHGPTGLVFAGSAAACALAALWSLWRGWRGAVEAASTMLAIQVVTFVALRLPLGQAEWTNLGLYRALSTEGVIAWGALLTAAATLTRRAFEGQSRGL